MGERCGGSETWGDQRRKDMRPVHGQAEVYDLDNDKWTLLECKLEGQVTNTEAGLIKKYYVYK